jgi:septal ring-binding cell division protein DamX
MHCGRILTACCIGLIPLTHAGCAGGGGEGDLSKGPGGDLGSAIVDYNSGDYENAHSKSLAAMRDAASEGDATARDQASYVAGLSAYRMRQFDEAETRLLSASHSSDSDVQGRSKAMLGLIRVEQNRPASAGEYFRDAATHLEGNDASEARYQASIAFEEAGNPAAADTVSRAPTSTSTASAASAGAPSGLFAIQVGAFENLANAQSAANDARALASREGFGEVRIIPRRDSRSRTLYVVQFGSFSSRTAAESARREIGRLNYIVAPLSRG